MLNFTLFFFVLGLSFIFCSLAGPRCLVRKKDMGSWANDKDIDCFFYIYTKHGHMKNEDFNRTLDKKMTTKNIHLILCLYFALEDINKNPHILPNISLLVKVECSLMDDWRKNSLSTKIGEFLPNYYCLNQRRYLIVLTGPIWLSSVMLGPLLYIINRPERIWVTTLQWDLITHNDRFLLNSFYGTFTFLNHHSELSGFKTFINKAIPSKYTNCISLSTLSWIYFNCSLSSLHCENMKNCSTETLFHWLFQHSFEISVGSTGYVLYNTVHAVAHALHKMLLQEVNIWPKNSGKIMEFDPWKMVHFLKNIQFINPVGDEVNMNQKENQDVEYDIGYIMEFLPHIGFMLKIGKFSKHLPRGQQLYVSEEMIEWNINLRQISPSICSMPCTPGFRKSPQSGKAVCCFDCTPCPENEISNMTDMNHCVKCSDDQYANLGRNHCLRKVVTFLSYEDPLGMSLACLALFFSVLTAIVLGVFLKHKDTPTVKANNRALSYVLLISLICSFLCSLLFIGHPNIITCILQQTIFAVVFTVAASTVLAKTVTVVLAFKITTPGRRMRKLLVSGAPNFIIPICTMIQLILCGIWLGISPPFVEADMYIEKGYILIICNKGSIIIFYCVLGYLGFIAMGSFTVAFLARNLPDTFNEAKFLTFSMFVFCSVWITFLPVYHSTKGKAMVAVEVFCILASSAGLLFCIFVPKCFIILLRPKKNSFEQFRNMHFKIESTH
ncbi:unknown_gene_8697 [Phodopus roborovskii]|uniref:Unknown_gene_8697 protein n=1 Tax=Phodopus roborovskii TaxID=109678 RepID=A0AAU9YNQ7_PHORO|nr:unknown_gene_8697 [Phodopus roborovskii]